MIATPRSRNRLTAQLLLTALIAGVLSSTGLIAYKVSTDPSFVFLMPSHGAQWIREPRPMEIAMIRKGVETNLFRTSITIDTVPVAAQLHFRAIQRASVYIDGHHVYADSDEGLDWRDWRTIDLTPYFTPGIHELVFEVQRDSGPPLLQARIAPLGRTTGKAWEASRDGMNWAASATAGEIPPIPASRAFPGALESARAAAPWLALVFALAAGFRWAIASGRWRVHGVERWGIHAVRAGLLVGLAVLGANNLFRVPAWFGFDVIGHMEYIHYIAQFGRLPYATEGWKMNEAPLFYLISSIPYRFIYAGLSAEQNTIAMRILPILCGLAQVELAYRAARLVVPVRNMSVGIATAVCALIPMNIYLSQFPSNQPLVGVFASLTVYFAIRTLVAPRGDANWALPALLGMSLGLAILSKVTAILILPVVLLVAALPSNGTTRFDRRNLASPLLVLTIVTLISGWYFVRNAIEMGHPFSVGYSSSLGTVWRQDPGFRAPDHLVKFGEGLLHPIFACFVSYPDSLYSTIWSDGMISSGRVPPEYTYGDPRPRSVPPWNFVLLGASSALSVIPCGLIVLGAGRALLRPVEGVERGTLLSVLLIATHLCGMVYLYLSLPSVSAGKAAYLLNVLPCFGLLAAQGYDLVCRRPVVDALVVGAVSSWGVASYLAFFAR